VFNLKSYSNTELDDQTLLQYELNAFDIHHKGSHYSIRIGDDTLDLPSLRDCAQTLTESISEVRSHLRNSWENLSNIATRISKSKGHNSGRLSNLLFLNIVNKTYILADLFSELSEEKRSLEELLNSDIASADDYLIDMFNTEGVSIKALHKLIMEEMYRLQIIKQYMIMTKTAQISGPWANLDMPMGERMWKFDEGSEETEYLNNRQKSRREQTRYNPESQEGTNGFYFVFQDRNRDPYLFTDREDESPYPSHTNLSIA
jgi:hypothetical protein